MKKYIEVEEEVLERLVTGKYVEGSLHRDEWTGKLTFKAYNRQKKTRTDKLLKALEHGWVKESAARIKVYESIPKALGPERIQDIIDRENEDIMDALDEWDPAPEGAVESS